MINFSELLWKSGQKEGSSRRIAAMVEGEEEIRVIPALRDTAVESAKIEAGSRIAQLTDPRGAAADRFRYLRMRLREFREVAKLQSIVITSPMPEDGKSTVAVSLATALAEGGKSPTLLIDADMHHSSIAANLSLRPRSGLAECLEGGLNPMSQILRVEPFGWHLLDAGHAQSNPTEIVQSATVPAVMQAVSSYFDWIVIDTPPVLPLTDALSLSKQVDAVLLVVRAGRNSREAIAESMKLIGEKRVVGIVLNEAEGLTRLYSKYYGHYAKK